MKGECYHSIHWPTTSSVTLSNQTRKNTHLLASPEPCPKVSQVPFNKVWFHLEIGRDWEPVVIDSYKLWHARQKASVYTSAPQGPASQPLDPASSCSACTAFPPVETIQAGKGLLAIDGQSQSTQLNSPYCIGPPSAVLLFRLSLHLETWWEIQRISICVGVSRGQKDKFWVWMELKLAKRRPWKSAVMEQLPWYFTAYFKWCLLDTNKLVHH